MSDTQKCCSPEARIHASSNPVLSAEANKQSCVTSSGVTIAVFILCFFTSFSAMMERPNKSLPIGIDLFIYLPEPPAFIL